MDRGVEDGHSHRTLCRIYMLYICCYLLATAPVPTRECEGVAPLYPRNPHIRYIQDDPRVRFPIRNNTNVTVLFEPRGISKFV